MGLSQDYKKRVTESFDMEEGGSLHAVARKAVAINAPVLIIGLGGTGVDALLRTKKKIYDLIQREQKEDGTLADKPKNIEYLAFDTDESYKHKKFHGMGLNQEQSELNIFTLPKVQPVLENIGQMSESIFSWIDTSIPVEAVINGAAAVRQLGRLLLMQNIDDISKAIRAKIKKVTVGYNQNVPLYVFIIAGISGGTGSGSFIDIPYLVRAIGQQESTGRVINNIGLLFLPDVNAQRSGIDDHKKSSLYANGFASLKELDYLQNLSVSGDVFKQTYGSLGVGVNPGDKPVAPYNTCLLLSSKDKNGTPMATGDEAYDLSLNVVAETVFNFILGDGGNDPNHFSLNSWLSNDDSTRRSFLGKLDAAGAKRPVGYSYCIAGASSAKLPMDDIMSYLAFKMYQEVQNFWDQRPAKEDVDKIEKDFHLVPSVILSEAMAGARPANTSQVTAQIAVNNTQQVIQLYEAQLKKNAQIVVNNLKGMLEALEKKVNDPENLLSMYFKDLKKGPVFAQQCLYSTAKDANGNTVKSVTGDLANFKIDCSTKAPTPQQIQMAQNQLAPALDDIRKALLGKDAKLQVYLSKLNQLYQAKLQIFTLKQLDEFCSRAYNILIKKNNEIFDIVSDLLKQMMPIFKDYGNIVTSTSTSKTASGTSLTWSMVKTPDFIRELDKRMAENEEFSVNLGEVVSAFYKYLFDHVDVWKEGDRDAVEQLNGFIYTQFEKILDNSMDFFLELIAESQGKTLSQYCQDIVQKLVERSEVRYPLNASFMGAIAMPEFSFVSIPNNAPRLEEATRAALRGDDDTSAVTRSGIRDRIFMMNFYTATPLSLNADIQQFYGEYKALRSMMKGLHLYVPTKVNGIEHDADWRTLPSPYPETEWAGFTDPVEKDRNDKYRAILDKAIKYGYVKEDVQEKKMSLYYGTKVDYEAIAEKYGIDLTVKDPLDQKKVADFTREIGSLLTNIQGRDGITEFVREAMPLGVGNDNLKKDYEEMAFIQLFTVRDEIAKMVENHEATLAAVASVKEREMQDNIVEGYVKSRVTGVILKHPNKQGVYVIKDRKGAVHELITLDLKMNQMADYYIFGAYVGLPQQVRDFLMAEAQKKVDQPASKEDLAKRTTQYKDMIAKIVEDLNWNHGDVQDGTKILGTYQSILGMATLLDDQLNQKEEISFGDDSFAF